MGTIDELYAGNIHPLENFSIKKEYKNAQKKRDEYLEKIKKELPKDKRNMLEKLWNYSAEMEYEFGKEMFKSGFFLALGLMTDMNK